MTRTVSLTFKQLSAALSVFLLGGQTFAAPISKPGASDPKTLLRQMLRAETTVALTGNQVTTLTRAGSAVTSTQRVMRNGGRALRLEYTQPPRLAGEQIVDNGRIYWHYIPTTNTLEIGPSHLDRMRRRMPQVLERIKRGGLDVQSLGVETVAGHVCTVIQVKPKEAASIPWRRFWIDTSNGAQLRIDEYNAAGQQISTSYFTEVSYAATLDNDSFKAPTTPKSVHIVALDPAPPLTTVAQAQAQVVFHVLEPQSLPPGFRFQSASVSDYRGQKLVTLRYVNALNVLSLFETPGEDRPHDNERKHMQHPRHNVTQTFQAGLHVLLVSGLPPEEAEKVLTSLH